MNLEDIKASFAVTALCATCNSYPTHVVSTFLSKLAVHPQFAERHRSVTDRGDELGQ